MFLRIICPDCGKNLKIDEKLVGAKIRCPDCKGWFSAHPVTKSELPSSDPEQITIADPLAGNTGHPSKEISGGVQASANRPAQSGHDSRPSDSVAAQCTNVGFFRSAVVAVVITAFIYWVIHIFFRNTYIGTLSMDRGKVPVVVAFLAVCSAVVLLLKFRKLKAQQKSLLLDIFSGEDLDREKIRPHDIDRLHSRIQGTRLDPTGSFLLNRLVRGMEHFRRKGDVQQARVILESQADLDSAAVDSSYTMLKVIIWSVPILGFIGTVAGISESVSFFSGVIRGAKDIAEIKGSLGGVTTGLALAFDVTLIALVMSVLLMFPMNWLQKAEEDNLGAIHDYCNEKFLMRLAEDAEEEDVEEEKQTLLPQVREEMEVMLNREQEHLQKWLEHLEKVGTTMTHSVAEGWAQVHSQIQVNHKANLDGLEERMAKQAAAQEESLRMWTQRIDQAGARLAEGIAEGLEPIRAGLEESDRRRAGEVEKIFSEAASERKAFMTELRPHHEHQIQLLSRASQGLGEAVSRVQGEIADLERRQAQGITNLTAVLSANLQSLQEQASHRGEAQLEALDGVAKRIAASLEGMQGQAEASLREWSGTWKRAVDAMGENVDRLGREAAQVAQASLDGFADTRKSMAEGLRALVAGLEGIQARQVGNFESEIKAIRDLAEGITGKLPEQISRQIKGLDAVLQGTDKLLKVEQVLAANLKTLATTEGFKKLFASLGAGVVRLGPALDKLDHRLEEMSPSLADSRAHRGWKLPFLAGRNHRNNNHE